jgi:fumarate reductase subunit C
MRRLFDWLSIHWMEIPVIIFVLFVVAILLTLTFVVWQVMIPLIVSIIVQDRLMYKPSYKLVSSAVLIGGIAILCWLHPMPARWFDNYGGGDGQREEVNVRGAF